MFQLTVWIGVVSARMVWFLGSCEALKDVLDATNNNIVEN